MRSIANKKFGCWKCFTDFFWRAISDRCIFMHSSRFSTNRCSIWVDPSESRLTELCKVDKSWQIWSDAATDAFAMPKFLD